MNTIVTFDHVCVDYFTKSGHVRAAEDVSLAVDQGQVVALLGPTGCGKSTLLNALAGFVKVSQGEIRIEGKPVTGPGPDRAFVFQNYALFPWLSVHRNVEFGLRMRGMGRSERRERAMSALASVGLASFANKRIGELSGGMRQRVGIARVVAMEPRVMLLDEPFGALDQQTRSLMQSLFLELAGQTEMTSLFVTHDIDEAILLSDVIVVITARPGRVKALIENPMGRRSAAEVFQDETYIDLKSRIVNLLEDEVRLAFLQEKQILADNKKG